MFELRVDDPWIGVGVTAVVEVLMGTGTRLG